MSASSEHVRAPIFRLLATTLQEDLPEVGRLLFQSMLGRLEAP